MDGAAMSKSRGNLVEPGAIVGEYGADTLRATMLFAGPIEDDVDWADVSTAGMFKWLTRLCRMVDELVGSPNGTPPGGELARLTARTIAGVTEDFEAHKYNTAIAKLMTLANGITAELRDGAHGGDIRAAVEAMLIMLSPVAPHVTEELWHRLGNGHSVHRASWPGYDPALLVEETRRIVLQVDGKLRDTVEVPAGAGEDEVTSAARALDGVARHLEGRLVVKVVWVPDRLLNFVTRPG